MVGECEQEEQEEGQDEETDNGDWQLAGRPGTKLKCPLCRHTRNTKVQILKHIKTHEVNEGLFNCDVCNYQSNSRNQVIENFSSVHENIGNRTYECRSCESTFCNKTEHDSHIIYQLKSNKQTKNTKLCHKYMQISQI